MSKWITTICFGCLLTGGCTGPQPGRPPSYWVATVDHGCKPGVAYELWIERGACVQGAVSILDPASWDGGMLLHTTVRVLAPIQRIEHDGLSIWFWLPENNLGGLPGSGQITLDAPLSGPVGKHVSADVALTVDEKTKAPWFELGADIVFERVK